MWAHNNDLPYTLRDGYPKSIMSLFLGPPTPIDAADADNIWTDTTFKMYIVKDNNAYEYNADTSSGDLAISFVRTIAIQAPGSILEGLPWDVTALHISRRQDKIYVFVGDEMHSKDLLTNDWTYDGLVRCIRPA